MPHTIPTDRSDTEWRNENAQRPPKRAVYIQEAGAAEILKNAHAWTATAWTGDFHNAKQVLFAVKKRIRRPSERKKGTPADIRTTFHAHRMRQAQQSRLLNTLTIEIQPSFQLSNARAPDIYAASHSVYDTPNGKPFLLLLNQLLGFIGAYEWHKKGIDISWLDERIHVPFDVFSPLRGECLDLVAQAPLTSNIQMASDIDTGSGIIIAALTKRGIPNIIAADTNPKAIACATANLEHLGLDKAVDIQSIGLFPEACADLIVCNLPWLPTKPTSAIEIALYDPNGAILTAFLSGVSHHLNPNGEAWLIISDLAEHLHLRDKDFLNQYFQTASLDAVDTLRTKPQRKKAIDESDPLALARDKEITYLYHLKAK